MDGAVYYTRGRSAPPWSALLRPAAIARPSMLRSPLLPIFLTVFVDVLGLTLVLPLLPFYAQHFGATELQVGALIATYSVCQLVSGPILGRVSDRVGRKPTLLVSQIGTCVGFLVLGSAHSLWMLFLSRAIDGMTAGNLTIAQAYISDVTTPENRTKAFGLIGVAFGTGFMLGPPLSGELARRFSYGSPGYAAAALSFLSVVLTATLLPARPPADTGAGREGRAAAFRRLVHRPLPRRRLLAFFAFALSFATLTGGLALYLERRFGYDVRKVGYIYAYSGVIGGLIQGGLIGRMAKRLGEDRLALFGFMAMAAGYALLGALYQLPPLLAVVALTAVGSAVVRPSLTTLLTRSVGPHEQGTAIGVSQSLSSVALIVGPMVATWLIGHDRLAAYGLAAASFSLLGVLIGLQKLPAADAAEPAPP